MALSDKTLTCVEYGNTFTFTVGEQEFFASRGYTNEPTRSVRASRFHRGITIQLHPSSPQLEKTDTTRHRMGDGMNASGCRCSRDCRGENRDVTFKPIRINTRRNLRGSSRSGGRGVKRPAQQSISCLLRLGKTPGGETSGGGGRDIPGSRWATHVADGQVWWEQLRWR